MLSVEHLAVAFDTDDGPLTAVDDVSFAVAPGEVVGLVGESGCGKTVTALSLVRLLPTPPGRIAAGRVLFHGADLLTLPIRKLRDLRGRAISFIFQEPMTALSPLHRIGWQMVETLQFHRRITRRMAWSLSAEWLVRVGLPDPGRQMYAYPHQLSGGMRQRAMIAMALMLEPELVIADEPTTALDVTIQAQILELMQQMKTRDMAMLLITHDMGVVREMCDRVAVMYAAEIVESGPARDLFHHPLHPYTEALLKSIPPLAGPRAALPAIAGQVPSALALPAGCRFHDRCPFAMDQCRRARPPRDILGDRECACFLTRERHAA